MKRHLLLSAMLSLIGLSTAYATETYTCPNKDGYQGEKVVDGELLFYDYGGADGNTKAAVTGYTLFKPSTEGDVLTIDFTSPINFTSESTHLYIYEGDCGYSGWKKDVPAGYVADLKSGDTFTYSTSESISVLYYCPVFSSSETGTGWEALLTTAPSKDMEWSDVTATQDLAGYCYPSRTDVTIIRADLITDGGGNAFSATKIKFTLDGTTTLTDISNLRCLYSGSSTSISGATQFGLTYDTATSTLEFADTQVLKSGHNYFWLVADVAADATPGNVIDATLTSAVVADTERVASAISPEGNRTIANMLFMESGSHTYNVGEKTINFYDDGGPEGKYTEGFSGTAVFYPTVEGKKVAINFTSLDLFNTSSAISVGNNDVINVYSGDEATAENLLATIIQNDPVSVNSVAANGALTVTFTSKTGYPTTGFEAEVSLFEPQAMEVTGVTAEAVSTETVSAGDSNQAVMLLDIATVNTEPAATVNNFKFSYAGTANAVSKASLYYVGTDKSYTSGTLVGETTSVDGTFTITADEAVALAQKDNYFRLTFDIDGMAQTGNTVGATAISLEANGETVAVEDAATVSRTVKNICYSEAGSKTLTIYGDWTYKNQPSTYSYYAYDNLSGNQTVTFLPGVAGQVVEMEFSKFSIAWPSYSTGSDPSFKIYSGETADEEHLLYSVTKETKSVVPTDIFRSSDATGALTVVFNTNGTSGSSSSYGFEAAVRLYQSRPMTITSIKAEQASTDDVTPSSTDNEIISVKVVTDGNLDPKTLQSVTVDLKGAAKYIKSAKLYATGSSATFAATEDKLLASVDVEEAMETATFTLAEAYTISEGTSYYWVAYDMQDVLKSDVEIDAALTKIVIDGAEATIAVSDPDGARVAKNIYLFQNGDNVVTVDDSLLFYDNGGANGNYTTDAKGTVTFKPTEGKIIKFTFNSFYTNVSDDFYVYNGTSTNSTDQLAKLYSSKSPDPIVSTADDGALTVKFNPTKSNTNAGWSILVTAFEPEPLAVSAVTATVEECPASVMRGSANNKMVKVAVDFSGEKGKFNISNFKFDKLTTETSALKNAKVWYTTSDTFVPLVQYGETVSDGNLSFDGEVTVRENGTQYFWLTYDIAEDAPLASSLAAKLTSVTIAGNDYYAATEATATTSVAEGMHGTYTIGSSAAANYNSFATAIAAMENGIDGEVVLEVESGSYVERITIPEVIGSSESNKIVIRSQSGNAEDVTVSCETVSGEYGAEAQGVLEFSGVNYATVENITFTTANTAMESVVLLKHKSRHNTLKSCRVIAATTTSYSEDINLVKSITESDNNTNCDYFTVEDCYLEGGYIGVSLNGGSTVSPVMFTQDAGAKVINNKFVNQGSKAMYINSCKDVLVDSNTIENDGQLLGTTVYVIDAYRCNGNSVISNNTIKVNSGSSTAMYGIYLRDLINDYAQACHKLIYNNDIQVTGASTSKEVSGIKIWNNKENIQTMEIVNNTIVLRGEGSAVSSPFFINDSFKGCKAYNNLLQNEMTAGYAIRVQKTTYVDSTSEFKSNAGYAASGLYGYVGADCTFEEFETAVGEVGGISEEAAFISADVHELAQAGSLVAAVPVEYVTKDILGRDRAEVPTIGAYEYVEAVDAPVMLEGYPTITSVTYNSAKLTVATDVACVAQYVVLDASVAQPSVETVAESENIIELGSNTPASVTISDLNCDTTYKAYLLFTSYSGAVSDVFASEEFTTSYLPTAVSTFENVTATESGFEDGTAAFTGFEVVEVAKAPVVNSTKVAKITDGEALVTLTNANGLVLDGSFIKNDSEVTLTAYGADFEIVATKTVAAGDWRFISFRDLGALSSLGFSSEGETMIDDFSGEPNEFKAAISSYPLNQIEGTTAHLAAYVTGGVSDYTITWTNATGEVIGTGADIYPVLNHSLTVYMTAVDAWGNSGSDKANVIVKGGQYVATFEDLQLEPESHWCGEVDGASSFLSGSYEFSNYYMPAWSSWAMFGYSNSTSTTYSTLSDQFNSAVGSGAQGSDNYGVAYVSSWYGDTEINVTNTNEGQVIPGVWLTNTAWVKKAILEGDGMSTVEGGFTTGDYLKLIITGEKEDESTSSVECYLADYRNEDSREHYLLDTWQWFDLTDLGAVTRLTFTMEGTKSNSYGITTPTYFCLDNLGGEKEVAEAEPVTVYSKKWVMGTIDAKDYFDFDPEEASIAFDVDLDRTYARVDADGIISFPYNGVRSFDLTVHACQKGKNSYVKIPVTVDLDTSVEATVINDIDIYPVPAHEVLNISTDMRGYKVEIFNMGGACVLSQSNCEGFTTIGLDSVIPGNYLLRITHESGIHTQKIIVK